MQLIRILIAGLIATAVVPAGAEEPLRGELRKHCFRCHGEGKVEGQINLVKLFADDPRKPGGELELLEKIIDALSSGEMPPEDEKQPTKTQRTGWLEQLNRQLKVRLAAQPSRPRVPIRRMNRLEYNNAVKHLFQLQRDPFALPERTVRDFSGYFHPELRKMPDVVVVGNRAMGKSQFLGVGNTLPGVAAFPKDNRAEHGFDNRGDHLSLSPVLMESFYALSQSIVNSPTFPVHAKSWPTLFRSPPKMTPARLQVEGERRLAVFLRQAFRRDVSDEIVAPYQRHFRKRFESGHSFTDSMKAAVSAALVSPRFLYVYSSGPEADKDRAKGEGTRAVPSRTDFELATRLSLFLWSSIPDDTLLDLASQGKLRDPVILAQQADRMMNDPRVKNFCDSFALQWLQLDRLVSAVPDNKRFRDYYFAGATGMVYMVGMHMMIEPLLVFETVMVEDRPITELIDSDFSYRSEMLSRWYEPEERNRRFEVIGIRFRRLPINDRRWGGVITNAAVLTMTSSPLRTKPITRGAWLATTIFNDPPAPPPADVPEIEADEVTLGKKRVTLRDQLKQHVVNQQCAGCHKKIDPLGFALENYDPVGRWREKYRTGLPIDSSGKLFHQHEFKQVVEFKDAILAEKHRFARAFAGHLLSYAVGRKLEVSDRPALERIVSNSAASAAADSGSPENDSYRLRKMIKEVILSPSFRQ